ncbi:MULTISPECIES: spermidine synthase [unclassified Streptomyces]|uniref:spermidine synthase n=1 Tax=unclassified Streptomyces TaxID=2593676 RepID=UPI002E3269D2|nr:MULTISPECIES: fused MFS/spermidine synthase [unclassified Streptomyces]WUC66346.1 fused MFS/spermidine synthase [Streptomyces sp. NBC_00539]
MAGKSKGKRRGTGEPVVGQVDGGHAELAPDRERARAWTLLIDGAPQSHVDLADPLHLDFAYQRRIGHLIDLVAPARRPLNVVHLGGGALTLARYTAASRPRSTQQVVEIDAALVAFVREHLPLDPQTRVRIRAVDARAGLAKVPDGWADLVIADVFSGSRTPAHLTSTEFLDDVRRALAPTGWYVANLTDGPPLTHLRGQIATAASRFAEVALAADPVVWRGKRFGNAVLVAADRELPVAEFTRRVASDPHPGRVEHGRSLSDFAGGATPVADASAVPSPQPPPSVFD